MARFERQVIAAAIDAGEIRPDGQLDPADLARRAEHAMRAHMASMRLRRGRAASA
jgi:hypothetical protein